MQTVIWIVVGIVMGIIVRTAVPRGGIGGVIGDMTAGVLGAGLGAYMVETVALGHILGSYTFWNIAFAGGVATGVLVAYRALTNQHGIEDDVEQEGATGYGSSRDVEAAH